MKNLLRFLMLILVVFACKKEDDISPTDQLYTPPVIKVQGSVAGQVVDEDGNSMEGVSVHVGNKQTQTNAKGYFSFRNIDLDANGTFIRVKGPSHFQASKRFFPKANSMNYTRLTLMRKTLAGEINAANGGDISVAGGATITLPANSVVGGNDVPYTGTVKVNARWLSPSDQNLANLMPGNLHGISDQQEEVALANYGVMAVELSSSVGTPVQIASGAKATLTIPIPDALQGSAPTEIPLWHFDENTGLWRQEGSATREGNAYVGEVSHFSFWSWNIPLPYVNIQGKIVDPDGSPLGNTEIRFRVYLSNIPLMLHGAGFTDNDGVFSGKVPANEAMELSALNACGRVLMEADIAPSGIDIDMGVIESPQSIAGYRHVTGTLVDCSNNPIAEGVFVLCDENGNCQYAYTESDGSFELGFALCQPPALSSDMTVIGYDLANGLQSLPQDIAIAQDIDLGNYQACTSNLLQYIRLTVDGSERLYYQPYYFGGQPGALMTMGGFAQPDSSYALRIAFPASGLGSFTGAGVKYWSHDFGPDFMVAACEPPCNDLTVVVTEFGLNLGEYVRGTFSGNLDYYNQNQQLIGNLPVTGEFSIRR